MEIEETWTNLRVVFQLTQLYRLFKETFTRTTRSDVLTEYIFIIYKLQVKNCNTTQCSSNTTFEYE